MSDGIDCLFLKYMPVAFDTTPADFLIDHKVLGFRALISQCVVTLAPLKEAEITDILFLNALAGCSARRFKCRVASHTCEAQRRNAPVNVADRAARIGILVISASLDTVAAIHNGPDVDDKVVFSGQRCAPGQILAAVTRAGPTSPTSPTSPTLPTLPTLATLATLARFPTLPSFPRFPGSNTLTRKHDLPSLDGKVAENAWPASSRSACLKPRDLIHDWLENGIGNLPEKECKATVSRAESRCGEATRADAQAQDMCDEVAQALIHKLQVKASCQASRKKLTQFCLGASLGAPNDTPHDTPNDTSNATQDRQLAAFEAAVAHDRP